MGFKYNACDENNWDLHGGGYPVSNAVSQFVSENPESNESVILMLRDFCSNMGSLIVVDQCGQLEQSYQDYTCPKGEEHMQCEVDKNMKITAVTQ